MRSLAPSRCGRPSLPTSSFVTLGPISRVLCTASARAGVPGNLGFARSVAQLVAWLDEADGSDLGPAMRQSGSPRALAVAQPVRGKISLCRPSRTVVRLPLRIAQGFAPDTFFQVYSFVLYCDSCCIAIYTPLYSVQKHTHLRGALSSKFHGHSACSNYDPFFLRSCTGLLVRHHRHCCSES